MKGFGLVCFFVSARIGCHKRQLTNILSKVLVVSTYYDPMKLSRSDAWGTILKWVICGIIYSVSNTETWNLSKKKKVINLVEVNLPRKRSGPQTKYHYECILGCANGDDYELARIKCCFTTPFIAMQPCSVVRASEYWSGRSRVQFPLIYSHWSRSSISSGVWDLLLIMLCRGKTCPYVHGKGVLLVLETKSVSEKFRN